MYKRQGEYNVKEVTPPAGFVLSDEVKTVTLTTEDKETAVFEFTNRANEAKVRKLDSHTCLLYTSRCV